MPELPEVETMVRGVRSIVEGRTIVQLRKVRCRLKPIPMSPSFQTQKKKCQGQRIESVFRIGKRIVIQLDSKDYFVIEPRMTGLLLIEDAPSRNHLRLEWVLDCTQSRRSKKSLWFWDRRGLGTVSLWNEKIFSEKLGPEKIGPDALQATLSQWSIVTRSTKRAIKIVLMDQRCIAGIGNIYASEILHRAGIHPATPACNLEKHEIQAIVRDTRTILKSAIRMEGSTLSDGTYRNAINRDGSYQNLHRVYNRKDETCPSCSGARIQRIVQAQRSSYFCPACQQDAR